MRFVLILFAIVALFFASGCQSATSPGESGSPVVLPGALGIYYGWPSGVNGSSTPAQAAAIFGSFSVVVLGDGIEHPVHGDHEKTAQILSLIDPAQTQVFGYVDLGVSTQNQSVAAMQTAVDQWKALGAQGIFWDDAGYDYGVTRERQNTMVDFCHAQGLAVFMNAWDVDDIAQGETHLGPGDWFLIESSLVSGGVYQDLAEWKARADKVAGYQKTLGIHVACLSSLASGVRPPSPGGDPWALAWAGAAIYGFDAVQLTDLGYSSGNNQLARLAAPWDDLGTRWAGPAVAGPGNLSRTSDRGTLTLRVGGPGSGSGGFEVR